MQREMLAISAPDDERMSGGGWRVIGDLHYEPVPDGLLAIRGTAALPAGNHRPRLVVVNLSGQFVPPYELQVRMEP